MKLDKFFKVLSYEEVAFFGKAQKNRKINESHVNDFLNILKNKEWVPDEDGDMLAYGVIPIVVNPATNHILDGQHKLKAFKDAIDRGIIPAEVKILVAYWYVYDEAHENEVTIMLNTKSKNWSLNDYINAYAQDIEYYSKLKEFCEKHSLCKKVNKNGVESLNYRYAAAIITGKGQQEPLKQGTFSFTDEQLEKADTIHNEMAKIREKLGFTRTSNEVEFMAKEWHYFRTKISADDIVRMTYIPTNIASKKVASKKDWSELFSSIETYLGKKNMREEVL